MSTTRTLYDVLGVRPDASVDDLRRAYRERARELHPDRNFDLDPADRAAAQRQMQELTDAWRILGDATRRRKYDRELAGPEPTRWQNEGADDRFATRSDGTMPEIIEPLDGTERLIRGLPWLDRKSVV